MNHNLLVGQSGGPTAVINGSLYGVVSEGLANPEIDNVIGMINGIEGFLANHTMDMAPLKENGELERIRTDGKCRFAHGVVALRGRKMTTDVQHGLFLGIPVFVDLFCGTHHFLRKIGNIFAVIERLCAVVWHHFEQLFFRKLTIPVLKHDGALCKASCLLSFLL